MLAPPSFDTATEAPFACPVAIGTAMVRIMVGVVTVEDDVIDAKELVYGVEVRELLLEDSDILGLVEDELDSIETEEDVNVGVGVGDVEEDTDVGSVKESEIFDGGLVVFNDGYVFDDPTGDEDMFALRICGVTLFVDEATALLGPVSLFLGLGAVLALMFPGFDGAGTIYMMTDCIPTQSSPSDDELRLAIDRWIYIEHINERYASRTWTAPMFGFSQAIVCQRRRESAQCFE